MCRDERADSMFSINRFSDLFALADEHELKPSKKKTAASKKKGRVEDSASDSDASEVKIYICFSLTRL